MTSLSPQAIQVVTSITTTNGLSGTLASRRDGLLVQQRHLRSGRAGVSRISERHLDVEERGRPLNGRRYEVPHRDMPPPSIARSTIRSRRFVACRASSIPTTMAGTTCPRCTSSTRRTSSLRAGRSLLRFLYPEQIDTFLYDPAAAAAPSTQLIPDVNATGDSTFTTSVQAPGVTLYASAGTQHLQTTESLDAQGDLLTYSDAGVSGTDLPIASTYSWYLPPGDTSGWHWRLHQATMAAFAKQAGLPQGQSASRTYDYDALGKLTNVSQIMTGAIPLQRFHQNATAQLAPSPSPIPDGTSITLEHLTYDGTYGNVSRVEGPNGYCVDLYYDTSYGQLLTSQKAYASACGSGGLTTAWAYDRGLEVVTTLSGADGSLAETAYDTFGRPTDVYLPNLGAPGFVQQGPPTTHVSYYTQDATHPTSRVSVVTIPSSGVSYTSWVYLDGFGQRLAAIQTGDDASNLSDAMGQWLLARVSLLDSHGNVTSVLEPTPFLGDPSNAPLSALTASASARTYTYDGFDRIVGATDIDHTPTLSVTYGALRQVTSDARDIAPQNGQVATPTTSNYDGHGRLTSVVRSLATTTNTAASTLTTSISYQATGEVSRVIRAASSLVVRPNQPPAYERWMQYDSFGRLVLNAEPNTSTGFANPDAASGMHAWRYVYDAAGNLAGTSDARGCGKNVSYDALGRTLSEDYSPCLNAQAPYTAPTVGTAGYGDGTEAFYLWDQAPAGEAPSTFYTGRLAANLPSGRDDVRGVRR